MENVQIKLINNMKNFKWKDLNFIHQIYTTKIPVILELYNL